jgi:hypothetical protein
MKQRRSAAVPLSGYIALAWSRGGVIIVRRQTWHDLALLCEDCLCKRSFARIACRRCPVSCPGLLFSYCTPQSCRHSRPLPFVALAICNACHSSLRTIRPARPSTRPSGRPSCNAAKYGGNLSTVDPSCLLPSWPSYKRPACLLPCRHEPRWRS